MQQASDSWIRAISATIDISRIVSFISENYHILLMVPGEGVQSFVLGNQPCLLQRRWSQDENGNWQPDGGKTDMYVVLDPQLMVGIVENAEADILHMLDTEDVQRINGMIIKYSDEVVARDASDLHGAWYKIFEGEDFIRTTKDIPDGITLVQISVKEV